jgi:SAM-dependent methyltransferase
MAHVVYDHKQSAKELVRHVLFRCGLSNTLDIVRNWRGLHTRHVREQNMAGIFSQIYAQGAWVMHDKQDSLSGVGSARAATDELTVQLSAFLREVRCRRLVDIGCGDFNWMQQVAGDFEYLGIDVVPKVVEENKARYGTDRRRFICLDATRAPLETGDVAVCREVLFHLSFQDGLRLLRNIRAAGFQYVLFTNDTSIWFNSDIRSGDFRRVNLTRSPFNLAPPARELTDDRISAGRVLAVWPGSALPS